MVQHLDLRACLVVCVDEGEAAAPGFAVRGYGGGAAAAIAAAQVVDADDEVFFRIQRLSGTNHPVPPSLVVFLLPEASCFRQFRVVTVCMVAAGKGMEEEDGVALVLCQLPVCFVSEANAGQGFSGIESEMPQRQDVGADGAVHGAVEGGTKKRPGE